MSLLFCIVERFENGIAADVWPNVMAPLEAANLIESYRKRYRQDWRERTFELDASVTPPRLRELPKVAFSADDLGSEVA